jgi:type II secretory pathway component PulM
MASETTERRAGWKTNLLTRLHDPVQLRIGVMLLVLVLGYVAVYMPLTERIAATARRLEREQKVLGFAEGLEQLQKQYRTFADRVPQQTDTKEWVQYVLQGTRQFPVKVTTLDCRDPRSVGPYRVIILQIELEGQFLELNQFLKWLEANGRLLRVDEITICPPRSGIISKTMAMHVIVSGLTG